MKVFVLLALCATASSSAAVQITPDEWRRADEAVVRLQPDAFPELPRDVRIELDRRGCMIPQPYDAAGQKKNVIVGSFTSAGKNDWAVLCSHDKRSAILVLTGGHSAQVESFAEEPDSHYLQAVDGGPTIGYSRRLAVVPVNVIRHHLPQANHAGILDTFVEKASVVWYRSRGTWIKMSQGD